jgi:O-antigen/teichoic acid export membrane protein
LIGEPRLKTGLKRQLTFLVRMKRLEQISLVRLTTIFTGGNIISLVLSLIAGLLVARFSNPDDIGVFNSISLTLGYVVWLQAGILNGLSRELPFYMGRGLVKDAESYAAAAQALAILIGGLLAVGMLMISGWYVVQKNWQYAAGFAVMSLASFTLFYVTQYLQVTYRTRGDFVQLSGINIIKNVFSLASVLLVGFFGYYGLCMRIFLVEGTNLFLHWHSRPLRIKPYWDRRRLFDLLKVGAPIFASGQLYAWWMVLNSTLVLYFFQTRGLGLYTLAIITGSTTEVLCSSLGQILYPRMAETYGKKEDVRALVDLVRAPLVYSTLVTVLLIGVGWFLLPSVVSIILPQYAEAVPAARWTLLAVLPLCSRPLENLFAVVKRMDFYFASIGTGMVVYVVALAVLINQDRDLIVFPQALLAGRVVMTALTLIFIYYLQKKMQSEAHEKINEMVSEHHRDY